MAQRGRSGTGSGPGRDTSARRRSAGGSGRAAPRTGRTAARSGAAPGRSRHTGARRIRPPRPSGRLTGRTVILALVLVALILSYAYPVRTYLTQRSQIARMKQHQAKQRRHIAALREQRAKWNDPRYVESQAKEHLQMVRPGARAYAVIDAPKTGGHHGTDGDRMSGNGPWYAKLWSSVRGADRGAGR